MPFNSALPPRGQVADLILPGGLEAFVTERRERKMAWDRIARDIWVVTGGDVDITGPGLQLWMSRLREVESA